MAPEGVLGIGAEVKEDCADVVVYVHDGINLLLLLLLFLCWQRE